MTASRSAHKGEKDPNKEGAQKKKQHEHESRSLSRSNLCKGHKMVLQVRTAGLLAAWSGINTG